RTHLLYPAATWQSTKAQAAGVEKASDQPRSMGEGSPGLVWRSQKPIWTTDLVREMCVPRSHNAQNAGLSAGVWFALKTDQTIFGVLEFLGNNFPEKTPELMSAVENLGILIGRQLAEKPRVSKR
ncbi:MAG: GAF domain-containing protein, partial [Bdellovibrionota bacterium]